MQYLKPKRLQFDATLRQILQTNDPQWGVSINTNNTYEIYFKGQYEQFRLFDSLHVSYDGPVWAGTIISCLHSTPPYDNSRQIQVGRMNSDITVDFPIVGGFNSEGEKFMIGIGRLFIDSEERLLINFTCNVGLPAGRPFHIRGRYFESQFFAEVMRYY